MLAAKLDDSDLICDSLKYVEPVQISVQQLRQTLVELVSTGKWSVEALKAVRAILHLPRGTCFLKALRSP